MAREISGAAVGEKLRRTPAALLIIVACWYGMMAIHELGHASSAIMTGGKVTAIVLHPISRTDIAPNPNPAVVVWAGPLVGVLLPLVIYAAIPRRWRLTERLTRFFAGFCLIANGAYIGVGGFDAIGDCRVMLQTGTPLWMMVAFGFITVPLGLWLWHGLGK